MKRASVVFNDMLKNWTLVTGWTLLFAIPQINDVGTGGVLFIGAVIHYQIHLRIDHLILVEQWCIDAQ